VIDGALLAVIAERAGLAPAVLERLEGPLGESARRSFAELRTRPSDERMQAVAGELARVGSPSPPSWRAVHPEWRQALLEAEPEARLASEAPSLEPAAVWLLRRALGALPRQAPSPAALDGALRLLGRGGALALATLLGARRAALAAALAQLGDRGAPLRAVARELEARTIEPMELRVATAACRGVELRQPHVLERIGAAALRDALRAEPERWAALCYFVPRALGMMIAAQLAPR
jgi:hypothetical protein